MAEATEELVKIYLEQKGYLVTVSKREDSKTNKSSPRSAKLKDEYLYNIFFQTYVFQQTDVSVANSYLLHVNSNYNKEGKIEC